MSLKNSIGMAVIILTTGAPLLADSHLPKAPQHYIDVVVGISVAEQYVWHCPSVNLNEAALGETYGQTLERLADIGVSSDKPHTQMILPPVEETDGYVREMLARNEAAADPQASFCNEAMREIASETLVGSFLIADK